MAKGSAAGLIAALAAAALGGQPAYADGPFSFSPFGQSSAQTAPQVPGTDSQKPPQRPPPPPPAEPPKPRNDNPRTTSAGFDPEALERGAKALREINSSSNAKQVSNSV